jgi:hypothetical protein
MEGGPEDMTVIKVLRRYKWGAACIAAVLGWDLFLLAKIVAA